MMLYSLASGVEEGKDMFLANGEAASLYIFHPHILQTHTVFQLFLLKRTQKGSTEVACGMGKWKPENERPLLILTSSPLYQVRLSELSTNQYSREEPLMRDTGILNQPLRMSWFPAALVPPCFLLEARSNPIKSG